MKVITWKVNGIRARADQLGELLAVEQPDVVCLQEVKAPVEKVPELLVSAEGYWCYWHGAGGYSGVALLVRHSFFTERPAFSHPAFDMENRIVLADLGPLKVASVYVPNGGKDYDAKLRFCQALRALWPRSLSDAKAETSTGISLSPPRRRPVPRLKSTPIRPGSISIPASPGRRPQPAA